MALACRTISCAAQSFTATLPPVSSSRLVATSGPLNVRSEAGLPLALGALLHRQRSDVK
jgi:hypothetical protein